ncbi:MAG: hypothetical protein CVU84_03975 [Firmicutes bacterium HGW-Firmicutes-1]|nr:MAG: hypothetical protein CVU84_03975 [Firmicutes bacterium HGW-Firmicutes-1]
MSCKTRNKNKILIAAVSIEFLIVVFLLIGRQSDDFVPSPILLYSIETQLNESGSSSQLLNYDVGNVGLTNLLTYEEWMNSGGHQGWRLEPLFLVKVVTSNLVPENISQQEHLMDGGDNWKESGNATTNIDGVIIKLISPTDNSLENPSNATKLQYRMIVPHLGSYDIMVEQPQKSAIFIVTRIVFNPNSFN